MDYDHQLPMWVVYDHPTDYPNLYVARRWLMLPALHATAALLTSADLDSLRWAIQRAMPFAVRLERSPDDDAKIMEIWL